MFLQGEFFICFLQGPRESTNLTSLLTTKFMACVLVGLFIATTQAKLIWIVLTFLRSPQPLPRQLPCSSLRVGEIFHLVCVFPECVALWKPSLKWEGFVVESPALGGPLSATDCLAPWCSEMEITSYSYP